MTVRADHDAFYCLSNTPIPRPNFLRDGEVFFRLVDVVKVINNRIVLKAANTATATKANKQPQFGGGAPFFDSRISSRLTHDDNIHNLGSECKWCARLVLTQLPPPCHGGNLPMNYGRVNCTGSVLFQARKRPCHASLDSRSARSPSRGGGRAFPAGDRVIGTPSANRTPSWRFVGPQPSHLAQGA